MTTSNELIEALDYLNNISETNYKNNKDEINNKIFSYLYFQPKFKDQQILVDKIIKSLINNKEIYFLIKINWHKIPKLFKDKFYYFIKKVIKEIPFNEFFLADLDIKNYVLNLNIFQKDLIYKDILITSQLSTLEIYKKNPNWFEIDFLIKQSKNPNIPKKNRLILFDIINKVNKENNLND